ncbi:DNA adenine methylase [Amycolatopsis sp. NPDC004772]
MHEPPPPTSQPAHASRLAVDDGERFVPFMKWAGGKRWFVHAHADVLPRTFKTYIEPFLGGGSVYFHLKPRRAILGDSNPDLICAYQGIKAYPREVEEQLRRHHAHHSSEYYYQVRNSEPDNLPERAARVIYLNRTCFNGIYRVNRQGKFNVPVGTRSQVVFDTDDFPATSRLLRSARIHLADFEQTIKRAKEGDLVFADPPYTVRHNNNGFVKYNETLFSWADQIRLARALRRARDRGAMVVATNAAHDTLRELYEPYGFQTRVVSRFSAIAADAQKRKTFDELIVLS